jgi:hypothetical protein
VLARNAGPWRLLPAEVTKDPISFDQALAARLTLQRRLAGCWPAR